MATDRYLSYFLKPCSVPWIRFFIFDSCLNKTITAIRIVKKINAFDNWKKYAITGADSDAIIAAKDE